MNALRRQKGTDSKEGGGEPAAMSEERISTTENDNPLEVGYLSSDPNGAADAIDPNSARTVEASRSDHTEKLILGVIGSYALLFGIAIFTQNGWWLFLAVVAGSVAFGSGYLILKQNMKRGMKWMGAALLVTISMLYVEHLVIPKSVKVISSDSARSSNSGETHQCGYCKTTFSGHGWMHVAGEQYQPTSWLGAGYCSRKCADESQPSRWKR
ncbi:MAG: hypothetical protein KA817_07170 [Flavobacteriales bacterium]|nr:hypothetical protein [Flavobacteriales bacterium]